MIEWTDQATRQLDLAHHYIALSNSEEIASRITMQIVSAVQQLEAFPMSGRAGRVPGTRELVIAGAVLIGNALLGQHRHREHALHRRLHYPEDAHRDPRPLSRGATVAQGILASDVRQNRERISRTKRVRTACQI